MGMVHIKMVKYEAALSCEEDFSIEDVSSSQICWPALSFDIATVFYVKGGHKKT